MLFVAIGCAGEWYLHHHPTGRKKQERDAHHKLESRFIGAVALGVAMEFFALGHSIQEGVKLERELTLAKERTSTNELRVALLEKETSQLRHVGEAAKESAALASVEAEKAKKEREVAELGRLELEKQVESLKKSNLELEEKSQPRRISDDQKRAIVTMINHNLAPFFTNDSIRVSVVTDTDNGEGGLLASRISEVLKECKIISGVARRTMIYARQPPVGLFLGVKDPNNPPAHGIVILDAFTAHAPKLEMSLGTDVTLEKDQVIIFVGLKPW